MTAAGTEEALSRTGLRSKLLRNSLLFSAGIFFLLEIWRPCFFTTDDNLTGGFPLFTEMGHRLAGGQSPFVSAYLFGGNYPLLHDATFFSWHPIYLLSSLLVVTPAHFYIMEVCAFFFLMLTTAGFVCLADYLRREVALPVGDGWITFYALSYTYTFMAVTAGSSWLSFLGNHSAMPWLALGILQTSWRRGLIMVTLFSVHHILGGHLAPLISISLFLSLFALGMAIWRRSLVPLMTWGVGTALAILMVLPLLLPALHGFAGSDRGQGLSVGDVQLSRIPPLVLPFSYFFGTFFWVIKHPQDFYVYRPMLAACAASWCVVPALCGRSKWRLIEVTCLGLTGLAVVLVVRPVWITEIMLHIPLLRSMRYPFRELLELHFFLHLFFVVRQPGLSAALRRWIATACSAVFVMGMVLYAPPSLNQMKLERQLLFSGELERYWAQVKQHLGPDDRYAVIIPQDCFYNFYVHAPFALLGSHNFGCLTEVINASGYSVTTPKDALYVHVTPAFAFGAFLPSQEEALWKERPNLKLMVLESTNPVKITLKSHGGPDIDLSPYVPSDVKDRYRLSPLPNPNDQSHN